MNRKFYIFCIFLLVFSVVFRGFSYLETGLGSGSGSGYMVQPSMAFKSWRIGRSPQGTDVNNREHQSFITSTGTSCSFEASVGYQGGNQPRHTSPIDPSTVTWSVFDGNQGFKIDPSTTMQHNWSGSHPSKLARDTSFNVVGKLELDAYEATAKPDLCKDENNHRRHERTPTHRNNTKLAFKIRFQAQTIAGQTVSAVLPLEADEKDQLRQEYVDRNKPIPSRDDLEDDDTYDFGHYGHMLNSNLESNHEKWFAEINKLRGTDEDTGLRLPEFSMGDFVLTSGYRNPHHNYHHAGSTATLSPHVWGYALDVRGRALSQERLLDINGDGVNDDKDRELMKRAAKPNAGARGAYLYETYKHVHADWAPSDWYARSISTDKSKNTAGDPPNDFSLPPAGTDTVACDMQTENNCDVQVSSGTEHYVTCPGSNCGESYWTCDSDDYDEHRLRTCNWERLPLGSPCNGTFRLCEYPIVMIPGTNLHTQGPQCPTDPNGFRVCEERNTQTTPPTPDTRKYACGVHDVGSDPVSSHSLQASCSVTDSYGQQCTVTDFYNCLSHTHQYPALISGACGHTYTSSDSYNHRSETCPTDANGNACTSGSYFACQLHTHVYPAPPAPVPTVAAPVWSNIPDPYNLTVGDSFYLDLSSYVTGSPTFSRNSSTDGGTPSGTSLSNGIISGTLTRVQRRVFRILATNSGGTAYSEWILVNVRAAQ